MVGCLVSALATSPLIHRFATAGIVFSCLSSVEHVLLDCPSADLANLCVKHHQLFRSPSRNSNRLRDFISQADTEGLALYVHECLECCAQISGHNLACLSWFRLQACLASAKLPSSGRYSFVT